MTYEWTEENLTYWSKTLKLYGLTPKELQRLRKELLVKQDFHCAVCVRNLEGKAAFLDHDHNSGMIRGMLCFPCNRFRVAKNTSDTAVEVVRYLADPPAPKIIPDLIAAIREKP